MRTIKLCRGLGIEGKSHCVMAATSIVAGENFTDRPKCVSPVITGCLISLNDVIVGDNVRERLLSHLPWVIIGTNDNKVSTESKRLTLLMEYLDNSYGLSRELKSSVDNLLCSISMYKFLTNIGEKFYKRARNISWQYHVRNNSRSESFAKFIEEGLVPVYSSMPIEPGYNSEKLITL